MKLTLSKSKKVLCTFFVLCFWGIFSLSTNAQSSIYLFMKKGGGNLSLNIELNGKFITKIDLPIKKTYPVSDTFRIPYNIYSPWIKEFILNKEGKNVFSIDCKSINVGNLKETKYVAEIQLNLSNGSKHYILLTNKGLFDVQLKEITEKEAYKMLNNKKYVKLPEYIEQ